MLLFHAAALFRFEREGERERFGVCMWEVKSAGRGGDHIFLLLLSSSSLNLKNSSFSDRPKGKNWSVVFCFLSFTVGTFLNRKNRAKKGGPNS